MSATNTPKMSFDKPYGTVHGSNSDERYTQNGKYYNARGEYVRDVGGAVPAPVPEAPVVPEPVPAPKKTAKKVAQDAPALPPGLPD